MHTSLRYKQATKEARWALGLTIFYLFGWIFCAYFFAEGKGVFGFPLWFELSCIYLPILFVVLAYWIIKRVYQDIELESSEQMQGRKQS